MLLFRLQENFAAVVHVFLMRNRLTKNIALDTMKFKKLLELNRKNLGTLELSVPSYTVSGSCFSSKDLINFQYSMFFVLSLMSNTKD